MFLIFMVYNHLYYHLSKVTKLQAHCQIKNHNTFLLNRQNYAPRKPKFCQITEFCARPLSQGAVAAFDKRSGVPCYKAQSWWLGMAHRGVFDKHHSPGWRMCRGFVCARHISSAKVSEKVSEK